MKIDIASIIKDSGGSIQISERESLEDMNSGIGVVSFDSPVEFTGSVTNFNGMLLLKGVAKVHYSTVCDRCGDRIDKEFIVNVDEDIIERAQSEEESEESSEDDRFTFSGNVLELDRILADALITNIPMTHICREDCQGLCPLCGAKMNGESCKCDKTEQIDPRLEALKEYFD